VVYHEYFHAVMDATLGSLPQWFNEGLAEYYSTFRARPGSTRVEIGHPIEAHLRFLAEHGTIPWDDVFRTTTESRSYNEGTRQGAFYAQSWLLVHYLGATDERAQAAGRFLTLLREGNEPEAALTEALGMDPATLIAEVERYRTTGSSYVWWDLGEAHAKVDVTIREIEPAELLYWLGDLLAHRGQLVTARNHLEAARTGGWPTAQLSTSLGFAALAEADTPGADAQFRAAIEAGADDAEPYVRLAEILIERFVREAGNNMAGGTPAAIVDARELLDAALEREPENFPALIAMARTYLFDGDTTTGIAALARGKALRPLDLEMLELEACLLARGGEVESAWALVQHAIAPKNGSLGRRAGACVADGVTTAARELLEADDRPAALLILATAMETLTDSELHSRLEPLYEAVAGGDRIVFVDHETPKVDEFRQLMETVRTVPPEEALAKVEEFLVHCQARRMCGVAEKTADELRELISQNRETGLDPAR
jgi:tetratricopeptide (TPR) repeat protein